MASFPSTDPEQLLSCELEQSLAGSNVIHFQKWHEKKMVGMSHTLGAYTHTRPFWGLSFFIEKYILHAT